MLSPLPRHSGWAYDFARNPAMSAFSDMAGRHGNTGPATQPYSATEVDGWQQLSWVSQNRAAVHWRSATPLLIYQMKVEMHDIRPAFSMPYLGDPALSIALDFPYRSRSVAFDQLMA